MESLLSQQLLILLNMRIKLISNPYTAVVSVTAWPKSIIFVNNPEESGFRATPSQAPLATRPSPIPEPMAPRPAANPAPSKAAQVGANGRSAKSPNSRINAVTNANIDGVCVMAVPAPLWRRHTLSYFKASRLVAIRLVARSATGLGNLLMWLSTNLIVCSISFLAFVSTPFASRYLSAPLT